MERKESEVWFLLEFYISYCPENIVVMHNYGGITNKALDQEISSFFLHSQFGEFYTKEIKLVGGMFKIYIYFHLHHINIVDSVYRESLFRLYVPIKHIKEIFEGEKGFVIDKSYFYSNKPEIVQQMKFFECMSSAYIVTSFEIK